MTNSLEDVEAAALQLSAEERAQLIERLIDTVLPASPLHPAWAAEIERRVALIRPRNTVRFNKSEIKKQAADIRALSVGRKQTSSEILLRENRDC